jgi:hypothetical protein
MAMCASWRRRLSAVAAAIAIVGAPAGIIASSTVHLGGPLAGQVCPNGTNWDVITNSCQ